MMMKHGVMSLTIGKASTGTQQAVSLHRWNTAEDKTRTIEIYVMSFVVEMHAVGSNTGIRGVSASNKSSVKNGTMTTMVRIMTNLTDSVLPKGSAMQEESRLFPTT
jgi:hypothetical protein